MSLSGEIVVADENLTVGPVEAGDCDYTSITDALDNVLPITENIHVVAATYNETLAITDQSINITGGYVDCAAAQSNTRIAGSMSTLDPSAHGMYISAAIDGGFESINITGFNVVDGLAGFINSGGINIIGEVNVTIIESRVAENASNLGGGIYIETPATLFIHDTMVENNEAVMGGGIYCNGCSFVMNGASGISDNEANENGPSTGIGGGLYLTEEATASLLSGSINPSVNNHGIHSNQASSLGGGIYVEDSELLLFGYLSAFGFGSSTDPVNITNNSSGESGGGMYITDGSTVSATVIDMRNNNTGDSGAAIFIEGGSSLTIDMKTGDSTLESCWSGDKTKCNRINNNYIANGSETDGQGGAIRSLNSEVHLEHVWFEGNSAGEGEGAVIRHQAHYGEGLWIENSVMFQNGISNGQDENIIHANNSHVNMRSNTLVDNTITDQVIRLIGSPVYDWSFYNNIIHNENGGDIFELTSIAGSPNMIMDCFLVHDDSTLPALSTAVFSGNPNFYDRGAGDLHLTSDSHQAVDKCIAAPDTVPLDMDLQERIYDVSGMGNELTMNVVDIGADEFTGNDIDLDIIFADGFD
ncbi:hypothetical protein [Marinicella sp. W31]|uniref:hypothetical protein n=1 Tax=Marinicella sp. W31 TaxID=3023713 RepID=UPI00375683E6